MKCYIDSFAGLVPCIAIGMHVARHGGVNKVLVKITATRGAYKRGEQSWHYWSSVVPRGAVFVKRGTFGQYRIRAYSRTAFDAVPQVPETVSAAYGLDE